MSDHLAIGGVSLTLKALLEDRMEFARPDLPPNQKVTVTISPPDVKHEGVGGPRLNLFLYQIAENGYLKNQEIPGQGHPGAYGHPPLSLDLQYLITAYGTSETNEVLAHQVLGDAMRVLHDFTIITDGLRKTRDAGEPPPPILDTSLLGQFENIKLYLQPISLEELSKVWTALSVNYRLSVAYLVSVVQIESQRARPFPLPVKERRLFVVPFRRPQITEVTPMLARIGDTLTILGVNFASSATRVILDGVEIPVARPRDDRLDVTIPDDARLQPGPQPVEVVTGVPGLAQSGFHSNLAVFVLVPTVTSTDPASGPAGTILSVTGQRLFREGLVSMVLVGDTAFSPLDPADPDSPAGTVRTPTEVRVRLTGLDPDTYRVRARVNGAESLEEDKTFEVTP